VVTHLEQVHRPGTATHLRFGPEPGIARKENLEGTVLDEEHQ
jgi:hypothetical protein